MRISENRTAANRSNAKKSTGPRTPTGLAKAAKNARSHGLSAATPVLPGDHAEEGERHRAGIGASLAPIGALEEALADRIAVCLWRLRRVVAYETGATIAGVEEAVADPPAVDPESSAGRDLKRLSKSQKKWEEVEEKLESCSQVIQTWEEFPAMGEESPIPRETVRLMAEDLAEALPPESDFEPGSYSDFSGSRRVCAKNVPDDDPYLYWLGRGRPGQSIDMPRRSGPKWEWKPRRCLPRLLRHGATKSSGRPQPKTGSPPKSERSKTGSPPGRAGQSSAASYPTISRLKK